MYKKIGKKVDQVGFDSLAAGKNFPMFERAKFLAHIFSGLYKFWKQCNKATRAAAQSQSPPRGQSAKSTIKKGG